MRANHFDFREIYLCSRYPWVHMYISVTVWWFLWATIRNSFQFAFSSEAESGSPIFSAPLLKDFERFLLCFISNIAGHHLIERCKRMKAMLSFFMGVRCGDLTQDPSDSQRQVRNMSIDEVWPDNKTLNTFIDCFMSSFRTHLPMQQQPFSYISFIPTHYPSPII